MSPRQFPTVILLDYMGVVIPKFTNFAKDADHEVRALAMGLNLYMVSENCDIGIIKHPLKRKKANTFLVDNYLVNGTVRVEEDLFQTLELGPLPEPADVAKRRKRS